MAEEAGRSIVEMSLLYTLIAVMLVFFAGRLAVDRIGVLRRLSIPAPVIGGVMIAVLLALADGFAATRVTFDMSMKDPLLLIFFTTVGLSADARMLRKGGRTLVIFVLVASGMVLIQNVVGLGLARLLDLHPTVGLIGGSITLTGGHGTGAAYATRFGETMNLPGAMELAMACATAGLVLGAMLAGPLGQFLIRRYRLTPTAPAQAGEASAVEPDAISVQSFLATLFMILICLAGGKLLAQWMQASGFILPDFLFSLMLGVVLRNLASFSPRQLISAATVEFIGGIALSLFLVMALMAMKLVDLASLAGPLLLIVSVQTAIMLAYAAAVTFRAMGRNYDAAILASGHVGFGLASTAAALASMKAVTERSGPSPTAFLIVSMVGAFFIDVVNALAIQGFLALPLFGF
jgi:ESS family glutamate:Na+ symporter